MAAKKELYQRGAVWWMRFTHPLTSAQIRRSAKTKTKEVAQQVLDEAKAQAWHEAAEETNRKKFCVLKLEANMKFSSPEDLEQFVKKLKTKTPAVLVFNMDSVCLN